MPDDLPQGLDTDLAEALGEVLAQERDTLAKAVADLKADQEKLTALLAEAESKAAEARAELDSSLKRSLAEARADDATGLLKRMHQYDELVVRLQARIDEVKDGHTPTEEEVDERVSAAVTARWIEVEARLQKAEEALRERLDTVQDGKTPTEDELLAVLGELKSVRSVVESLEMLKVEHAARIKALDERLASVQDGHTPTEDELKEIIAPALADALDVAEKAVAELEEAKAKAFAEVTERVSQLKDGRTPTAEEIQQAVDSSSTIGKALIERMDPVIEKLHGLVAEQLDSLDSELAATKAAVEKRVSELKDGRTPTEEEIKAAIAESGAIPAAVEDRAAPALARIAEEADARAAKAIVELQTRFAEIEERAAALKDGRAPTDEEIAKAVEGSEALRSSVAEALEQVAGEARTNAETSALSALKAFEDKFETIETRAAALKDGRTPTDEEIAKAVEELPMVEAKISEIAEAKAAHKLENAYSEIAEMRLAHEQRLVEIEAKANAIKDGRTPTDEEVKNAVFESEAYINLVDEYRKSIERLEERTANIKDGQDGLDRLDPVVLEWDGKTVFERNQFVLFKNAIWTARSKTSKSPDESPSSWNRGLYGVSTYAKAIWDNGLAVEITTEIPGEEPVKQYQSVLKFQGLWNKETGYTPGDVVTWRHVTWMLTKDAPAGTKPTTEAEDWMPIVEAQRGQPGKPGSRGEKGRGIQNVDGLLSEEGGALVFTFTDGEESVVSVDKLYTPEEIDERMPPLKRFRGPYQDGESYLAGDVVTFSGSLLVAGANTSDAPDLAGSPWARMISMAVMGGGGGGAAVLPNPAAPLSASRASYGWSPVGGQGWVDARVDYRAAANALERTSIRPEDKAPGTLVYQQDTGETYRWDGTIWELDTGGGILKVATQAQLASIVGASDNDFAVTEDTAILWQRINGDWQQYALPQPTDNFRRRLDYDPELPLNERLIWTDDRTAQGVVATPADLSDRTLLPASHISVGKLVYVRSEEILYELVTPVTAMQDTIDDWKPLVSGLKYVDRQGDLPDPSTSTLTHGQMFVVRDDFSGGDLERLVAWDETVPARNGVSPAGIQHVETRGTPVIGVPTIAQVQLTGMPYPGASNATAMVTLRITTATTPTHRFDYNVQVGDTLHDIAAGLAAAYDASGNHDPDTVASAQGDTLFITGSPGSPALPGRTVVGQRFYGPATSDADIAGFLAATAALSGDYVVNTSGGDLTTPSGRTVPDETAVILESTNPLGYHVADAPTPVVPPATATQQGTSGVVAQNQVALANWVSTDPQVGSYIINVTPNTLVAGGTAVPPDFAAVAVPTTSVGRSSEIVLANFATPPDPVTTGGWQPVTQLDPTGTTITDQASFVAAMTDPANTVDGTWWENTLAQAVQLYGGAGQANPNLPTGQNANVQPGEWVRYSSADAGGAGAWRGYAASMYPPGSAIGGTVVPGQWILPPNPPPEANYMVATQAPLISPDATVAARPQIDPTEYNVPVFAFGNVGPPQALQGGGWVYLNREVWSKDRRRDADQQTDQRQGDLQVTTEANHQELKVWDAAGSQWLPVYSRDAIDSAIAAMSLFEGTVNEVGGGAIGALDLDTLPNVDAMSQVDDLSDVSHYWTWVGSPNYVIPAVGSADALTNGISRDLAGAILNPGDWVQIANRGGDGSGVGVNGAPVDLRWVTVGGDLLAKSRADRLFGLQPWQAGGWEQGSLTVYDGDVYRATMGVTGSDGPPAVTAPVPIPITLSGNTLGNLTGSPMDTLASPPTDGDVEVARGSSYFVNLGEPFMGMNYRLGDHFVYSSDPAFAGTGITGEGFRFDSGWIYTGQVPVTGTTFSSTPPPAQTGPWTRVDLDSGLKIAQTDTDLPTQAPAGEVWIVLASAMGHGQQALFAYDSGAGAWQQLGGGGTPLELSGGDVIYPKMIFENRASTDPLSSAQSVAEVIGDVLFFRDSFAHPAIKAIAMDVGNGPEWREYRPNTIAGNNAPTGRADYGGQIAVDVGNPSKGVVAVANSAGNWVPVPPPAAPTVVPTRLWQCVAEGSFNTSGTVVQEGQGIWPNDGHGIDPSKTYKIEFSARFTAEIDIAPSSGSHGNYVSFIADIRNSSNGVRGSLYTTRSFTMPVPMDHWQYRFGWTGVVVLPRNTVPAGGGRLLEPRYISKMNQAQSGGWVIQRVDYLISKVL